MTAPTRIAAASVPAGTAGTSRGSASGVGAGGGVGSAGVTSAVGDSAGSETGVEVGFGSSSSTARTTARPDIAATLATATVMRVHFNVQPERHIAPLQPQLKEQTDGGAHKFPLAQQVRKRGSRHYCCCC